MNPYDLDEYLGPVWEAESSTGNGSTQQLPVPVPDPLPVLNTIDLGVLMESDEETLLETVIRLSGQDMNFKILLDIIKFIYSEKATKFCKIFTLLLTVCTVVKSKVKISQNFEAFSEYINFIFNYLLTFIAIKDTISCHFTGASF